MNDENHYLARAKTAFSRIESAFDQIDVDVCDCERTSSDVLTLLFLNGVKCVINTQRPTQQIWVASNAQAWHFAWDGQRWSDPRRDEAELFDTIRRIVTTNAGLDLQL